MWWTTGLKQWCLLKYLIQRTPSLFHSSHILCQSYVGFPHKTLGLHYLSLCVHRIIHRKKVRGLLFFRWEELEIQVSVISQRVFLNLLCIRPFVRSCWNIPKKEEMSFVAMGDKTHNVSETTYKAACDKSKPVWRKLRPCGYDAFYLRLPWTRVSMPGPCFDKATL